MSLTAPGVNGVTFKDNLLNSVTPKNETFDGENETGNLNDVSDTIKHSVDSNTFDDTDKNSVDSNTFDNVQKSNVAENKNGETDDVISTDGDTTVCNTTTIDVITTDDIATSDGVSSTNDVISTDEDTITADRASNKTEKNVYDVEQKIEVEKEQKQPNSAIKQSLLNIENLLKKMYSDVFDKISNFTPSYLQTVENLVEYIALKSAEICAFPKIKVEFNLSDDIIATSKLQSDSVPFAIKLSSIIDKKAGVGCTAIILREITKILLELLKGKDNSVQTVTGVLSPIYTYVLTEGIKLK